MNWNTDRIARLSGLMSRDEYRENALNESTNRSQVFEAEKEEVEETDETEEGDTVEEAKLRQIIRKEVGQVIDEVMAAREAKQLHIAQNSRNVGVAMGFASPSFRAQEKRPNRAKAKGPGGQFGFGGPGFM